MKNNLEERSIEKIFIGAAINMILVAVCILISGLIDGIIISRYLGAKAMASYGLVHPVYLLITALSSIVSSGAQTYCGQLLGKGKIQEAKEAFTSNCVTTVIISVFATLVILLNVGWISNILGAVGDKAGLREGIIQYIYGLAPAFVFIVFLSVLNSFMFLEGDRKRAIMATTASAVVNITGDLLNAFVFHKGLLGMAIATSVSFFVAFVILICHFRHEHILGLTWTNFSFKPMKEIIPAGLPPAINKYCYFFRTFALNRLIALMSAEVALVAFSVRSNLNNLYGSVATGIAHAVLLLGAVYIGEEDKKSVQKLFKISLKYGLAFTTLVSLVVCIFANQIVRIYIPNEPEAFTMTVVSLRLYMISVPLYMIAQIYMNLFQAMGKKIITNIICVLDNFGFVVLFSYVLGFTVGLNGVWISFFVGEVATLLFIFILVCMNCKGLPRTMDDFIMLPKEFDLSPKERYRVSINTMQEVTKSSQEIQQFLENQGADKKTAYYMALCVEEIAGNIIRWGFYKNKKNIISIYLVFKNDTWILRIRDNCKTFNPKKWMEMYETDKKEQCFGIRMVLSGASDVSYLNTLKMNNLIIKVPQSSFQ